MLNWFLIDWLHAMQLDLAIFDCMSLAILIRDSRDENWCLGLVSIGRVIYKWCKLRFEIWDLMPVN